MTLKFTETSPGVHTAEQNDPARSAVRKVVIIENLNKFTIYVDGEMVLRDLPTFEAAAAHANASLTKNGSRRMVQIAAALVLLSVVGGTAVGASNLLARVSPQALASIEQSYASASSQAETAVAAKAPPAQSTTPTGTGRSPSPVPVVIINAPQPQSANDEPGSDERSARGVENALSATTSTDSTGQLSTETVGAQAGEPERSDRRIFSATRPVYAGVPAPTVTVSSARDLPRSTEETPAASTTGKSNEDVANQTPRTSPVGQNAKANATGDADQETLAATRLFFGGVRLPAADQSASIVTTARATAGPPADSPRAPAERRVAEAPNPYAAVAVTPKPAGKNAPVTQPARVVRARRGQQVAAGNSVVVTVPLPSRKPPVGNANVVARAAAAVVPANAETARRQKPAAKARQYAPTGDRSELVARKKQPAPVVAVAPPQAEKTEAYQRKEEVRRDKRAEKRRKARRRARRHAYRHRAKRCMYRGCRKRYYGYHGHYRHHRHYYGRRMHY